MRRIVTVFISFILIMIFSTGVVFAQDAIIDPGYGEIIIGDPGLTSPVTHEINNDNDDVSIVIQNITSANNVSIVIQNLTDSNNVQIVIQNRTGKTNNIGIVIQN